MKKVIAVMLPGKQNENTAVFNQSIQALIKAGYSINLITNEENALLYSNTPEIDMQIITGKRSSNSLINGFRFLNTQVKLFLLMLKMVKAGNTVYISSVYPFAAAIAGKIRNAKVIYQLEEAALRPGLAERMMHAIVNYTAQQVIFTSATLKDHLHLSVKKQTIVYAALPAQDSLAAKYSFGQSNNSHHFTVGMVAPVQANKGIAQFLKLAADMPHLNFELVATGNTSNLKSYMTNGAIPANLSITGEQDDMSAFFERTSVVVNLSQNKAMLEPCDTNILQALNHGKPVIVPSSGCTKELINTKKHGVAINSTHLDAIADTLNILSKNGSLYNSMSAACKQQATLFGAAHFEKQIAGLFKGSPRSVYSTLDQFFGAAFLNTQMDQLGKQQAA